jgi:hypothetical protein
MIYIAYKSYFDAEQGKPEEERHKINGDPARPEMIQGLNYFEFEEGFFFLSIDPLSPRCKAINAADVMFICVGADDEFEDEQQKE